MSCPLQLCYFVFVNVFLKRGNKHLLNYAYPAAFWEITRKDHTVRGTFFPSDIKFTIDVILIVPEQNHKLS